MVNLSNTQRLLRKIAESPEDVNSANPHVGLLVPPSPFVVPRGWEFVLYRPFEGISYVSTVLHRAGYPVEIKDLRKSHQPIAEGIEYYKNKDIDVLGIATYEDSFSFLEKFIEGIRKYKPDLLILLGGSLVTSVPEVVMNNLDADIAVLGEGELTVLELMRLVKDGKTKSYKELSRIKGICFKNKNNELKFTQPRLQMENLNDLPIMDLSFWPELRADNRVKEILTSHSRGCYMDCSFCFRTTPKLSLKSVEKFKNELSVLKEKHQFEFIYFVDLTFAVDKKRTSQICEILKDFDVKWSCMTRVQNLDNNLLRRMKDAGCEIILYGFESMDQYILDKTKKNITPDETFRMVRLTREAGIKIGGLFILGLPGETEESLHKTINFIRKHKVACRVKYLSAIPGTKIYYTAINNGIIGEEVEHLRFLSREKGVPIDDFLNFTKLSDDTLRNAYKIVENMYMKGPREFGY